MNDRVMIIGGGGREHSLAWKLSQSDEVREIHVAPGNAGTDDLGANVLVPISNLDTFLNFAEKYIDFTIVGPDQVLADGIVDKFNDRGLPIFGPTAEAAKLESSKAWAADFKKKYGIPSPKEEIFYNDHKGVEQFICDLKDDVVTKVFKASELAEGKGVEVPESQKEALEGLERIKNLGRAGRDIVVQERLEGEELSVFAICDELDFVSLPYCRDYKRLLDGNKGPNTGGMGSYTVDIDDEFDNLIKTEIIGKTLKGMQEEGHPFRGVMYVGLILTREGPKVIEYNVRFGDPECQAMMLKVDEDIYPIIKSVARGKLDTSKALKTNPGVAMMIALTANGYPDKNKLVFGDEIFGLDREYEGVSIFHAGTKRDNGKIVTNGGRVLNVATLAETIEIARQNIYSSVGEKAIHFSGMHFRTDIGQ